MSSSLFNLFSVGSTCCLSCHTSSDATAILFLFMFLRAETLLSISNSKPTGVVSFRRRTAAFLLEAARDACVGFKRRSVDEIARTLGTGAGAPRYKAFGSSSFLDRVVDAIASMLLIAFPSTSQL
ncbi:hypothetical protein PsorP6_008132 [Peronosclerospora sorghi]|uniref:Uncharacterized protein n=1 Tax=Peronosclerospora sorghi TaxID=230839 RepID=A0ACC0W9B0_9STRA|nr:hypothetical protein PsorP6_008132 [Peronosclerospora sorghi]